MHETEQARADGFFASAPCGALRSLRYAAGVELLVCFQIMQHLAALERGRG